MTSNRFGRGVLAAALASATLLLGACATETTYHPAVGHGFERTGFSEQQIGPDRFIVHFAGNTVTPRETVEKYLLFRAAQLTLERGGDYFVQVDRNTNRQTRTYSYGGGGFGGGYGGFGFGGGYFSPGFGFYGRGFGYRHYDPFFGGSFFNGYDDVNTVDRVEAEAQVVIRRGPVTNGDVRAFDARAVVDQLGPTIITPGQERGRRSPDGY